MNSALELQRDDLRTWLGIKFYWLGRMVMCLDVHGRLCTPSHSLAQPKSLTLIENLQILRIQCTKFISLP